MPTLLAVPTQCPKCGGARLWDNRLTKKNPKQPDFKCKNRSCDGVIWPLKNGDVYAAAVPAPNTWQPPAVPVPPPDSGKVFGGSAAALTHGQLVTESLDKLFGLYDLCYSHASSLAKRSSGPDTVVTVEGIAKVAATLFIQACDRGLLI